MNVPLHTYNIYLISAYSILLHIKYHYSEVNIILKQGNHKRIMTMTSIIVVLATVITLETLTWLYYLTYKNPTIIDVSWPLVIMVASLLNTNNIPPITTALLILWALRLSCYLFLTRVAKGHTDKRYKYLSQGQTNKNWYYFKNFQLQGVMGIVVATTFLLAKGETIVQLSILALGSFVSILGLAIETLADWQLHEFKKHSSKLCEKGLWAYSRHPNYVGEILVWIGFSISLFPLNPVSWLGTLFLWGIMEFITIPITEKLSKEKRGSEYINYEKRVPRWLF